MSSLIPITLSLTETMAQGRRMWFEGIIPEWTNGFLCSWFLSLCMWFSRLWSCNITSEGCRHLSKMLSQALSLEHLDLGQNCIRTPGTRFLCEALKEPQSNLKSLWWVMSCWTVICTSKEFSSVADAFRSNTENLSQVSWVLYHIFSLCVLWLGHRDQKDSMKGLVLSLLTMWDLEFKSRT